MNTNAHASAPARAMRRSRVPAELEWRPIELPGIVMTQASLSFDHVHLVARDPGATAQWYVDKLGGNITRSLDVKGAPQIYISLGGFIVIVRGERPGERA